MTLEELIQLYNAAPNMSGWRTIEVKQPDLDVAILVDTSDEFSLWIMNNETLMFILEGSPHESAEDALKTAMEVIAKWQKERAA